MKTENLPSIDFDPGLSDSTAQSMKDALERQRLARNERDARRQKAAADNRKIREGAKA